MILLTYLTNPFEQIQGYCAQVHVSGINTCSIIEQVFILDTLLSLKMFARNRQCAAKYELQCKSNNIRR